jgi:hypothetical protein
MTTQIILKTILFGFFAWFFPFVISFLFYKLGGELMVSNATFKSVIMVVGILVCSYLLVQYFKILDNNLKIGFIVDFSWFFINIILDTLELISIMKVSFVEYFMTIGVPYFRIPAMSIAIGYLLDNKIK